VSPLSKRQRQLLRWGVYSLLALVAIAAWLALRAAPSNPYEVGQDGQVQGLTDVLDRPVAQDMASFSFDEVSAQAGINFRHFPAPRNSLLAEDMGSGVAWGDYDNDGDPDLFLVNFRDGLLNPDESAPAAGRCALYRNNNDGSFSEVSAASGLDLSIHGMAAAWGDFDNDGWLDLYVSSYGANRLMRNLGDGRFADVSAQAGVADEGFGAGVAWADFDRDGWIDLYLANYVHFDYRPEDLNRAGRQYDTEIPYTLNPSSYAPAPNRLYRNNGDGSFSDVAQQAGVDNVDGRSMQPVWFDFDQDGWLDLYVANDVSSNGVYRNLGDGSFADIGASSLAADYRGAMGLAVGDVNGDARLDLFVTHWLAQENALYENMTGSGFDDKNLRRIFFMEVGETLGLGYSSLRNVGWATGFADFDNDALPDLWVVNGHTLEDRDNPRHLVAQPLQFFRQISGRGFFDIAQYALPGAADVVGRGGAHADYDGDGKLDLAISVHGGRPLLLRNSSRNSGNWLSLRLRQSERNTYAVGARVELRDGERQRSSQLLAGSSYLSQDHSDLHFGLGRTSHVDEIIISWPDGSQQTLHDVEVNRVVLVTHTPEY